MAGADARQQVFDVFGFKLAVNIVVELAFVVIVAFLLEHFLQHGLAEAHILFALLQADETANARLGLAGNDEAFPVGTGRLAFRCRDFNLVAVAEFGIERHDAPVHFRAHRFIAKVGVQGVSKVHRRRTARQVNQITVRREAEYLVLIKFKLGVFEEFLGALRMLHDVHQLAQPAVLAAFGILGFGRLFVRPVGGNAELCLFVHFGGADLHFDAVVFRPDDRGMERAVTVRLGQGDIILEPPRHRRVEPVNNPQCMITLRHTGHEDAEGHDIRQLFERDVLALHFFPDGIFGLLAPVNAGFEAAFAQFFHQLVDDTGNDHVAPFVAQIVQTGGNTLARFGVQRLEGNILKLFLDFMHADTLGERRVNLQRFKTDAAALFRLGNMMQRAHVMQAVGQLDQQHADVFGHRKDEFAEIFRLLFLRALEFDFRKLGHAIDKTRDFLAEKFFNFFQRRAGVFDRIMQKRGADRRRIQLHFRQNARNFQRVGKIRIARGARLRPMRLHGIDIGAVDQILVHVGIVGLDNFNEFVLPQHPPSCSFLLLCAGAGRKAASRRKVGGMKKAAQAFKYRRLFPNL